MVVRHDTATDNTIFFGFGKVINAKKKTNVNKLMKKLNNKMKKSKYSKRKTILKPKTSKIYISNPSIKMANVKKMFRNYNKKFNKKTI